MAGKKPVGWDVYLKETRKRDVRSSLLKYLVSGSELLEKVIEYSRPGARLLETGCGTGFFSIFMSKMGYRVTAIDIDKAVVSMAREHNKKLGGKAKVMRGDILDLDFKKGSFDTVFNGGVLEHFSDRDIVRILDEAYRVSKVFVFEVPSPNARKHLTCGGYGDERLLTVEKWKGLIRQSKWHLKEVFHLHPFLSVIRSNPFKLVYFFPSMKRKHIQKISAAHGFVLTKKV